MKKKLITILTIMALVAALIVPSYGDTWDESGALIKGNAIVYLVDENGAEFSNSQMNINSSLTNQYIYINTQVFIDSDNGQVHDGKEILEFTGYNGSTLDNILQIDLKNGNSWEDVTDSIMEGRNFEDKYNINNLFRIRIGGEIQFSLQYKVLTDDTPQLLYRSRMGFVQVDEEGNYYYTKKEENVSTATPVETTTEEQTTEEPTTEEPTTEEPTTEEPTTEPEVNPNNYKYSFDSYYNVYPDENDNGVNLVTQNGATVEGVTATASVENAEYVIDNDESTIWETGPTEDPQWVTVDLGEIKTVKEIDYWWDYEETAKDYTVMVSTYGNEFQTVATIDNDSFYDDRSDMIVLNDAIQTRYIKIEMTESNSEKGYSLKEMAVYDDSNYLELVPYLNKINTSDNLARNKTPVVANGNHQEMARRYCDGNLNTTWSANKATDNSWFAVDLGNYYNIQDVMVCWSDANAVDYDVYVSSFEDWYGDYPVASVRDLWANKAVSAVSKDINVKARYVKIQVERWSDNSEREGITPCELVVFGEETEGYYNMQDYKWIWPWEYPTLNDKVFAGWYTDETLDTVYEEDYGYAYGKFIDEKVLDAKCQLSTDKTAIRFMSSTDISDYQEAGFILSGTYGTHTFSNKSRNAKKLYMSALANGDKIYPSIFSDESHYLFNYTLTGLDPELVPSMTWEVTPFYKTPDGTTVKGTTREFTFTDQ